MLLAGKTSSGYLSQGGTITGTHANVIGANELSLLAVGALNRKLVRVTRGKTFPAAMYC